jgi:hypothetical protein
MSVLKLLAGTSWGIYNKDLARNIGLEEAIIIGELASEYDYWLKQNDLDEEGYFYSTIENIEKQTTLSEYRQRKAMNTLKSLKLIDVQLKGLPAKRYVKLNEEAIGDFITKEPNIERLKSEKLISEKLILERIENKDNTNKDPLSKDKAIDSLRTSSVKSKELDPEKLQPNNNKSNNNKDPLLHKGVSGKPLITNTSLNTNSLAKNISLDDLENMTYLDIESNFSKSQNQKVLLAYINKSISSKKIVEELTDWLQLSYLHKKPLYLSGLMNQLKLLNGFSEEEIISIIKNCTLADKSTFKYEIEKREREKKYQNNININKPRVSEQKRTSQLSDITF